MIEAVNSKKDSSRLAQEQSTHLFLCVLISDLTHRYGPVVRQAKVVGVLESAFDVLVPGFGIEKRVHVDQMPIEVRIPCDFLIYVVTYGMISRTTFMMSTVTRYRFIGPTAM